MSLERNNIKISDPYWIQNPMILVDPERLSYFYPQTSMTLAEKINSIIRFGFYFGLILSIVYKNYLFLYIPIVVMVGSIIVYYSHPHKVRESYHQNLPPPSPNDSYDQLVEQVEEEKKSQQTCIAPTEDNPFMNFLLADDRKRPPACHQSDPEIKKNIESNFEKNLFMDVTDVYNKRHSQREFYTMPSTTIPNDQDTFAKWLYGLPPTCKEGNGAMCVAGNPERLNGESYQYH